MKKKLDYFLKSDNCIFFIRIFCIISVIKLWWEGFQLQKFYRIYTQLVNFGQHLILMILINQKK